MNLMAGTTSLDAPVVYLEDHDGMVVIRSAENFCCFCGAVTEEKYRTKYICVKCIEEIGGML